MKKTLRKEGRKMKKIVPILGILMLMLLVSCVGAVQVKKMNLAVEKKTPLILNLKNSGSLDSNIDLFMQSERLVKGILIETSGDEWGYYDVTYSLDRSEVFSGWYVTGSTLGIWPLLGLPNDVVDFDLYANIYIFDSNGDLIKEYHNSGKIRQAAGLYYGYNPTKRVAKKFSELYEKMFELASIQSNEINTNLQKAGKITDEKDKEARQKIKQFYENRNKKTNIEALPTPAAQPTPETFSGSNSFSSPKKSSNEIKFKEGKYAGSGTDFTMLFSFGSVSMSKGYTTLAMGTYRISGNQLVITFTYEAGGGNELRGKTYSYTISDSQNFSGMGEHWTYVGAY